MITPSTLAHCLFSAPLHGPAATAPLRHAPRKEFPKLLLRLTTRTAASLLLAASLAVAPARAADCMPCIVLKPTQNLSGSFVHMHPIQGFTKPLLTQGRFQVESNGNILWQIKKPMQTTTRIDQEGLTQSIGATPLFKIGLDQQPFLRTVQQKLLWALSGRWEKLEKDFIIHRKGTAQKWQVTLTPRSKTEQKRIFQRLAAKGGTYVEEAEILLPSGVMDQILFSDVSLTPQSTSPP